jgi:hypothetical protein
MKRNFTVAYKSEKPYNVGSYAPNAFNLQTVIPKLTKELIAQ